MNIKEELYKSIENIPEVIEKLYAKSVGVIVESQLPTGGTTASLKGSRYAGHVYPRDHAYITRAFISAGKMWEAKQALLFILNVELSPEGVMFQRYNQEQKNSSNKPPQIDGNAQTLISVGHYLRATQDIELINRYKEHILNLIKGLEHHTHSFPKGDLVFSVNGIIEFAPFEEGFEIYTNAAVFRAYEEVAELFNNVFQDPEMGAVLHEKAAKVKNGISEYMYIPDYGGFMMTVRKEPNPSVVTIANLKSFLALIDFDVYEANDPKIVESLKFHLDGTWNEETGGYNRYGAALGRHNFGNGPWPMVMMRLVEYYVKAGNLEEARKQLSWVLNVALLNKDVELGLPEHVVTKDELLKEFNGFMRVYDITPREERKKEYEKNVESQMVKELGIGYPVNPLVWSHAQFITVWNSVKEKLSE